MSYAPLWVKSNYSFLEGASHPDELVAQAHALNLPAIALTDRDGVYGIARAHLEAKKLGIKLIVGAELNVDMGQGQEARVLALASTRQAYAALCQLLTLAHRDMPKGQARATLLQLQAHQRDMLWLSSSPIVLPKLKLFAPSDVYALCARQHKSSDVDSEVRLRQTARQLDIPVVAASEVLYHQSSCKPLQDVLTCIRHKTTLDNAGRVLTANAEHALKSADEMRALFRDDPSALVRSLEVAERCAFSLSEIRYRYPAEHIPSGLSESDWLRELTYRGAKHRYGDMVPTAISAQIEKELDLVNELDYGGYFLTMWEIVEFCKRSNILCQGRGSAANSTVCYCLGVTAIDPMRMDLLFERFLSRERAEPPDIDLDIEHQRREEVIQWVYQRYGRTHAAMVANVVRYRARSAVREVGKVFSLPPGAIDYLSKMIGYDADALTSERMQEAGLDVNAPQVKLLPSLVRQMADTPRHLSVHPGGFLLGHEPVHTLVPIEPATMTDRTVIQWDKQDVDDLGLFKVDLLGLGALTQVHQCFDLLKQHENIEYTMATVPAEDDATYNMIAAGDTVGVFQIESRAQMAMLPRLKPRNFYDLVVEVAIVRPGPIQGNMVHPYLRRRNGEEPIEYPHESLRRVLEKTMGVPIFQEQVMRIAMESADYSAGEADELRRDMAAWKRSGRIDRHHARFVGRMIEKGIDAEFAERVFSQVRGFGEYGFPESHAASFALIAYVTSYLKCHHPAAFACSLLNAQPMGFYSAASIIEDAKRHRVKVLPIDINHSAWDCTLESQALRVGLRYVHGLGTKEREKIEASAAPYKTVREVYERTQLTHPAMLLLAEAGAFESMGYDRRAALWEVRGLMSKRDDALGVYDNAPARAQFDELSRGEEVAWDYQTSSHSARGHPLEAWRPKLKQKGVINAEELRATAHGKPANYVGIVMTRQRPATATGVVFLTLEDETGMANIVLWNNVFAKYEVEARTAGVLGIKGKVQSVDGVVYLIAEELYNMSAVELPILSRDFH